MAKVFLRNSTAFFSIIIFVLLMLCIGLLVAVLKGQMYHESVAASTMSSSHRISATTTTDIPYNAINDDSIFLVATESEDSTEEAALSEKAPQKPWENFRLPSYILPLHYDLLLHPNLHSDNFTGTVNILVNVTRKTNHFVVHAYKLNIYHSSVRAEETKGPITIRRCFFYDPNEYYVLELDTGLKPGLYWIFFNFSGTLVGSIVGFYKSRYSRSDNGETRYLATSKFQPTYARRAYPCFDEPTFKSTFTVSLVHETDYIALSNMPAEETNSYQNETLLVTKFQKSVPMVTYLTCFIVCDFEFRSTLASTGKEFRVYSTRGSINNTAYALSFGSKVLDYFEKYFGIEYSLPKQDMVAIPDFVSGAMEHWGVITFRETNLLYDPVKSSPQNKQRVSSVISHEMAHMWFGNLVTMEWWDDLWLNEGFASYIEYKGVDELNPSWSMLDHFVTEDLQPVMKLDSTMSSHPIVQSVIHPDEITEIFDGISYNKGASVLRMLEFFVGQENFRKGISKFLKKYQFKNAKTENLWSELSSVSSLQDGYNISTIMRSWTEKMGFPYISIARESNNPSQFTAKQQRFIKNLSTLNEKHNSSEEYVWHVPLSYITSNGDTGIIWLHNKTERTFEIPVTYLDWVKFNVNQTGYYLVNYEEKEWERFIHLLKQDHQVFTPADRANLLHDAFLLSEAGLLKYDIPLSLSMYLKKETHLIPWETAYAALLYLSQVLEATEEHPLIARYIREITEPLYRKLGWMEETGSHLDNLLRNTIIGLTCHSGNEDCLKVSSSLLQNWTQGLEVPPTLRRLVYHYGMTEIREEKLWEYMWSKYLEENSPQERKTLLYGLAHIQLPSVIQRYLEYSMDETKIRRQDFFTVLQYLAGNHVGRQYAWNFIISKWKHLVERFTLNDRSLGFVVKRICSYFTTEAEFQEMQQFFKKYPDAGAGKRRRQQALENVQNNLNWLKKYKEQVIMWLCVELPSPWLYYKLPPHIVPSHYDLTLHPHINENHFSGSVSISIEVKNSTKYILLHASDLNITETKITFMHNASVIPYISQFCYEENNYLVIQFSEKIRFGSFKLHFQFEGNISKDYKGMFKVSYTDPGTMEKRYMLGTQLESIYARRLFPCFDEPLFKSTFNIHVIHSAELQALSNAVESASIMLQDGLLKTTFEKTAPMATYLVCLVVGYFKYKEIYSESHIRIRIYSTPHNVERTAYALKVGSQLLQFFEKYFNLEYPLKKLDMVAIPGMSGAMENWGLITFGERRLLIDENLSSSRDKVYAASIISHELAHMWFGNLVTMRWWNDLWLNEGFAVYMSVKGVQAIEPSWNYEDEFVSNRLYAALKRDGTIGSHPIVKSVSNINKISTMFDAISYSKGAAILRMLEVLMGEDFQRGVSAYLKKNAYGSVRTEDLWSELTLASTKLLNIGHLMHAWTMQMNYPFISVTRSKLDPNVLILQQNHFFETKENKTYFSPIRSVWQIPLTYYTSGDLKTRYFILNSTEEISLTVPTSEWIKFNVNFTGYYLVNYEVEQWEYFAKLLATNHSIFSQTDRANFLYDSFALASAGYLSYEIPMNLSSYLIFEMDLIPWKLAYQVFREMSLRIDNATTKEMLRYYVKTLSMKLYKRLSWNDTGDYSESSLRNLMIHIACENENYDCLSEASALLRSWLKGEKISRSSRHLVYYYGMQTVKDKVTWIHVWNKYLNETSSREKIKLLQGLANVRDRQLLKQLMAFAEEESKVLRGHYFLLMEYISKNPLGHSLISDFIQRNWTELVQRFSMNNWDLQDFVKEVYSSFSTEEQLKEVLNFFHKYPKALSGTTCRTEILRKIQSNMKWLEKHRLSIENWLNAKVYMPWKNVRLPEHIVPSKYDIYIHPNITTNTFEGCVNITVNITKRVDYITVHSDHLTISKTVIENAETKHVIELYESFPFELNHFWVMRFPQTIAEGVYYLFFKFSGHFTAEPEGLVKTSYINSITEEERFLLYTQFEATYARKMFPCFDEPSMKSTFRVTVVHDPGYSVISNMPEENFTDAPDGLIARQFVESFPMSTYLVCIVVSDYAYTEAEISYGKKLRYFAPPDRLNSTLHTMNITPTMLKRFEEFYDIPYALPKLDFVSIPEFPMGGMENWGLVILGEGLLVDESTSLSSIIRSDKIVAHELAHQWFGNLVTMRWWDDIWLNEGFSTFAMYTALRELHPNSDELEARKKGSVMMKDASPFSRPIVKQVSARVEIGNMFDSISYEKGASVINMLQNVMKEDFRTGLSNYLKKFAYSNAETKDLWNELSDASKMGINITNVMDTWTRQMGFPYIEVEMHEHTFTARQKRFVENNEEIDFPEDTSPYGYIWKIPLTYKDIDTGAEYSYWLNEAEATFPLLAPPDACLKFNTNFTGYYIVKYDDNSWSILSEKLQNNHQVFSATDRYNLLFDVSMLVQEDLLSYDVALEMTKYMKKEKLRSLWQLVIKEFFTIINDHLHPSTEVYALWKKYWGYLTEDLYEDFQRNKSENISEFDNMIIYLSCTSRNMRCLKDQLDRLEKWFNGESTTDEIGSFLFVLFHFGNETIWEQLWLRLNDENITSTEQFTLGFGLTQFRDKSLIERTLNNMMSLKNLHPYTVFGILYHLRRNPVGLPLMWNWVKSHWKLLSQKLNNPERSTFNNLLTSICKEFSSEEQLQDMRTTFKLHPKTFSREEENLCYSHIENNIQWANTHGETISNWLRWNVLS